MKKRLNRVGLIKSLKNYRLSNSISFPQIQRADIAVPINAYSHWIYNILSYLHKKVNCFDAFFNYKLSFQLVNYLNVFL